MYHIVWFLSMIDVKRDQFKKLFQSFVTIVAMEMFKFRGQSDDWSIINQSYF
jgi:hypothetical protein